MQQEIAPAISILKVFEPDELYDTSGRPLTERSAEPNFIAQLEQTLGHPIPMELGVYTKPGPRHGQPINQSGFLEVKTHWRDTVNALGWINYQYFDGRPPTQITYDDLYSLSSIAKVTACFGAYRSQNPLVPVPVELATLYKTAFGIQTLASVFTLSGEAETVVDPEMLQKYGESRHKYTNPITGVVCPMEDSEQIMMIEALISGKGAVISDSNLTNYFPDPSSLIAFGRVSRTFHTLSTLYQVQLNKNERISRNPDATEESKLAVQNELKELTYNFSKFLQSAHIQVNYILGRTPKEAE